MNIFVLSLLGLSIFLAIFLGMFGLMYIYVKVFNPEEEELRTRKQGVVVGAAYLIIGIIITVSIYITNHLS